MIPADSGNGDARNIVQRVSRWTATNLFRNYIRRGVSASPREVVLSFLGILFGIFFIYLLTNDRSAPLPFLSSIILQVAAVAFPWFGALTVFGYLFGRQFGYEPLRDVDMMAGARAGAYAGGAAAGVLALLRLADQFWGG